jgi:CBS domain-containing protein
MTTTVRQLLDEKGHNVITVGADDTVFDAVRKMAEENIGSLIVCEGSKVIGLITERHYARNVFLEGRAYRTRAWGTLWRPQFCSSDPI